MKKFRFRLALITAVMAVAMSLSLVGVFAEGAPAKSVEKITGLKAYSSYNSVVFEWNKSYVVTPSSEVDENGDPIMTKKPANYKVSASKGTVKYTSGKTKCTVKGLKPWDETTITVYAYDPADSQKGEKKTKSGAPVRTIAYKFTVKSSTTLHSHAGPKRSYKLKAGQTLTCDRFGGGGNYMFYYPKSAKKPSTFYCAKIRAANVKAIYTTKQEYSAKEAELYVNAKGLKSRTGKLIWVNLYTQRIYYFKGPKNIAGKWKIAKMDDGKDAIWQVASGKASTPSPTGITGKKTVLRKVKKHHGIKWWLPYSEWNSVHGQRSGWKFGKPASHGCIRNPIKKMAWLYKQIPVGTTVNIF